MGIKFNLLIDKFILNEASEFSRFFTSEEPIKFIHDILKVSADTKLVLSPTNNRHTLWDSLREGKAIFAKINKPESIKLHSDRLKSILTTLPKTPKMGITLNEIKDTIKSVLKEVQEPIQSVQYKKIHNKLKGDKGVFNKIKKLNLGMTAEDGYLININEFLTAIKPGEYILVKRSMGNKWGGFRVSDVYAGPEERSFPVAKTKGEKVSSQSYNVYYFDGEKLINEERISENAVMVFRKLFDGWGDRDFYIIEDEKFLPVAKTPFIPNKDIQYEQLLPISRKTIQDFVFGNLNKFQDLLKDRINNLTDGIKERISQDIEKLSVSENEIIENIKHYRKAKEILETGVGAVNAIDLFSKYLTSGQVDLKNYLLLSTAYPYMPNLGKDPVSSRIYDLSINKYKNFGEWEIQSNKINKEKIELLIKNLSRSDSSDEVDAGTIKVALRTDPQNSFDLNLDKVPYKISSNVNDYMMFNKTRNRWEPLDLKYAGEYGKTRDNPYVYAIAFKTTKDYKDFIKKFVKFALDNIVKSPERRDMDDILSAFD